MLRPRSNCTVICVRPSEDDDVIDEMPEMVDSCRSIGEATEAAIVSGLAPGSVAVIWMVGKSTAGSAATVAGVGERPKDDQRRRHQRRQHRAADADLGNIHGSAAGDFGRARVYARAVGQEQLAVGDDGFTAVQP